MSFVIPPPHFPYEPLPTEDSIRLLRLAKHVSTSTPRWEVPIIRTTLEIHEIRQSLKFKALSYTSGVPYRKLYDGDEEDPPEPMSEIVCNGRQMPVTRNLFDALISLQKINFTGLIWIHGVCINHRNVDERDSHVLKISSIYSSAEQVIIWLGPYRRGIEELCWATEKLLPSVACPSHLPYRWNIKDDLVNLDMHRPELWTVKGLEFPLERLIILACFYRACRWFTRAWSVPEALLGENIYMLCGEIFVIYLVTKWHPQVAGDIFLSPDYRSSYPRLRTVFTIFLLSSARELDLIADYFASSIAIRSSNLSIPSWVPDYSSDSSPSFFAIASFNDKPQGPDGPLNQLMVLKTREDDIYIALRGVKVNTIRTIQSGSMEDSLHPDASALTRLRLFQFFSDLPRKINSRARLDVFWRTMAANYDDSTHRKCASRDELFKKARPKKNRGAENDKKTVNLLRHNRVMAAREVTRDERSAMAWIKIQLIRLEQDIKGKYPLFLGQFRALIQNLSCDESPDEKSIIGDLQHKNLIESSALTRARQMNQHYLDMFSIEAADYTRRITRRSKSRRLFRTEDDLLGLGTLDVQKNDEVWMLFNARALWVLRPTDAYRTFQVVGDCYVHGFMHAEILKGEDISMADEDREVKLI
ncbi:hypothetical protein QTJ16_005731 [Diplocarpon rosae]|uniref:Heterokaryon incompatibility domain-containing protein n=1 Tax=Diplocarpon rosae TaxID=946125 RepID=A0AAD9SXI6_9HELO|nr:hypothetical protein QTJ16_005731 [Diplocarpon rosae]